MIKEIKAGSKFYCYKTFTNDAGVDLFYADNLYNSEKDNCLTDENGNEVQWRTGEHEFMDDFNDHFLEEEEA